MGIADPYEKIFAPHSQKSHFLLACYPPVFGIAAYWDDH